MSYDIEIIDSSGSTVEIEEPHFLRGGTFDRDGTRKLQLNVTYNYAPHFERVLGEGGIRSIYGKTISQAEPLLLKAIRQLKKDEDEDYWAPTEGNARRALLDLLELGIMAPDPETDCWAGD